MRRVSSRSLRAVPLPNRADHRALLSLSAPLAATQLAQVALSTTDIVMMGALGTAALAGGGLALVLFNQVRTMGVGLLTGTANLVAAAAAHTEQHPDHDRHEIRRVMATALAIATVVGLAGGLLLVGAGLVLRHVGQEHEVARAGRQMLFALAPGLVPCLWFQVLRQVTVGLRRPLNLLWVTLGSVALNVVLNLALIQGWGALPGLGLVGIGVATSLVHLSTVAALLTLMRRDPVVREVVFTHSPAEASDADGMTAKRILRLGVPTALTYGSEAGLFTVVALVAGSFGATVLAAHNIVNQITYIVFQTAVGASHASSVLVSRETALGKAGRARKWAITALTQQAALVTTVGAVYLVFGDQLAHLFAFDATASTISLAGAVLAIAAVTQYADAAQNIAVGLLRGLDRAGSAFRDTLVGYWVVGLPAALLLAQVADLQLRGLWIGLGLGLLTSACLMLRRFTVATRITQPASKR